MYCTTWGHLHCTISVLLVCRRWAELVVSPALQASLGIGRSALQYPCCKPLLLQLLVASSQRWQALKRLCCAAEQCAIGVPNRADHRIRPATMHTHGGGVGEGQVMGAPGLHPARRPLAQAPPVVDGSILPGCELHVALQSPATTQGGAPEAQLMRTATSILAGWPAPLTRRHPFPTYSQSRQRAVWAFTSTLHVSTRGAVYSRYQAQKHGCSATMFTSG